MIPVTDPKTLAQLNGNGLTPVTDPDVLAQLNGNPQQPTGLMNNPVVRGTQDVLSGALGSVANLGQSIARIPHALGSLAGINIAGPDQYQIGGIQNFQNTLGVQNPNMVDKVAQGIGSWLPFNPLGKALSASDYIGEGLSKIGRPAVDNLVNYLNNSPRLSNSINQILPGALYGATQPTDASGTTTAEGAAGNFLSSAIPGAAGKLFGLIRPQKFANNLIDTIGQQIQQAKVQYNPVFNAVGNNKIYGDIPQNQSAYSALDKDVFGYYTRPLNRLNTNFLQNPTFQNAHQLQSNLGTAMGQLQTKIAKSTHSQDDINALDSLKTARSSLLTDMDRYLQVADPSYPGLSNQYADATTNWAQKAAPYLSNPVISKVVKQNLKNPNDPQYLPSEKLAGALGRISTPDPAIAQQTNALKTRVGLRNLAQRGVGAVAAGHLFPGADEVAMLMGGLMGPQIAKSASSVLPSTQAAIPFKNAVSSAIPYLNQSMLANQLTGGNQ